MLGLRSSRRSSSSTAGGGIAACFKQSDDTCSRILQTQAWNPASNPDPQSATKRPAAVSLPCATENWRSPTCKLPQGPKGCSTTGERKDLVLKPTVLSQHKFEKLSGSVVYMSVCHPSIQFIYICKPIGGGGPKFYSSVKGKYRMNLCKIQI